MISPRRRRTRARSSLCSISTILVSQTIAPCRRRQKIFRARHPMERLRARRFWRGARCCGIFWPLVLGCAAGEVVVGADPSGAPKLIAPKQNAPLFISISGRGSFAAFAAAATPIGVDLEILGAPEDVPSAMLHESERARLSRIGCGGPPQSFSRTLDAEGGLSQGADGLVFRASRRRSPSRSRMARSRSSIAARRFRQRPHSAKPSLCGTTLLSSAAFCYKRAERRERQLPRVMSPSQGYDLSVAKRRHETREASLSLMIVLRSILFNCAFYVVLAILMVTGMPTFVMGRHAVQFWARLWAKSSLVLLKYICGLKVEFRGLEHLPKGAALIAPKHQSFLETFALLVVVDEFTFVHKRELSFIPFFGWYLWGTGQIPIDRANRASALAEVIRGARRIFAEGRRLIIFPEGTRQLDRRRPRLQSQRRACSEEYGRPLRSGGAQHGALLAAPPFPPLSRHGGHRIPGADPRRSGQSPFHGDAARANRDRDRPARCGSLRQRPVSALRQASAGRRRSVKFAQERRRLRLDVRL